MQFMRFGSLRLFRLAGIDVWLHFSWFLALFFVLSSDLMGDQLAPAWRMVEFLALFAIVLTHEFGHALACRSVGGTAENIVLWPLGGVAFVQPPQRPGPVLWSIAAGPLVNVALVPVLGGLLLLARHLGWEESAPSLYQLCFDLFFKINLVLLIFNLLPIYPLDGGQILQSLLWFVIGRAESLMAVSILGLITGFGLLSLLLLAALLGFGAEVLWLAVMAAFIALRSWSGFRQARFLMELLHAPRHKELACPSCGAPPVQGDFWSCDECNEHFDIFKTGGVCPRCEAEFPETQCIDCQQHHAVHAWRPRPAVNTAGSYPSSPTASPPA